MLSISHYPFRVGVILVPRMATQNSLPVSLILRHGHHRSPLDGLCAMEAVAWLAGEEHSDRPKCASPILTEFVKRLNDSSWSKDEDRTDALLPILPLMIGTRETYKDDRQWGHELCSLAHAFLSRVAFITICAAEMNRYIIPDIRSAALAHSERPSVKTAMGLYAAFHKEMGGRTPDDRSASFYLIHLLNSTLTAVSILGKAIRTTQEQNTEKASWESIAAAMATISHSFAFSAVYSDIPINRTIMLRLISEDLLKLLQRNRNPPTN